MGFFSFVKNAGSKIFGRGGDKEPQVDVDPVIEGANRTVALVKRVKDLGIEIDELMITVHADQATVRGTTKSQADREKVILAVGNTHGISRVDDKIKVLVPEPEAVFYTVESGDTLSKIAKVQYGNAMKYPVIFEANKPMLSHPDKIYPGQVLRIPALEE